MLKDEKGYTRVVGLVVMVTNDTGVHQCARLLAQTLLLFPCVCCRACFQASIRTFNKSDLLLISLEGATIAA